MHNLTEKYVIKILNFLSLGVIIGFITGFYRFIYSITVNWYLQYQMFRLVAHTLQEKLNYGILSSTVGFIILTSIYGLLRWMLTKIGWKKKQEIIRDKGSNLTRHLRLLALMILLSTLFINLLIIIDENINRPMTPNIVWFLIDSLRADHLGCYGYEKNTSPYIDKFAEENILFKNAYSQESYTLASVPSYFTSTYPLQHQVLYDQPSIDLLDPRFITLAEILQNENYQTYAYVSNPHLQKELNIGQGFEIYEDDKKVFDYVLPDYKAFETAERIYDRLRVYLAGNKERPVFIYLHYQDVHYPYVPPPPYHSLFLPSGVKPVVDIISNNNISFTKNNIDLIISQYDGEIRYTDYYLKKTMSMLEEYNIHKNNSIIIITSDHGEEFYDIHPGDVGGVSHGRTLYQEQIHVPLIISLPHMPPPKKSIDSLVELIDVMPTLLDVLEINWGKYDQFQGKSLMPLIGENKTIPKIIYSGGNHGRGVVIDQKFKYYTYDHNTKDNAKKCFIRPSEDYKYVLVEELYNLNKDPLETQNMIHQNNEIIPKLKQLRELKENISINYDYKSITLNEAVDQLQSLGYV